MPVPARAGSRGRRGDSAWRFLLASLATGLCLMAYASCNRDFSDPAGLDPDGDFDTSGSGADTIAGHDTVKVPARPDSLSAKNLSLTAGDDAVPPSLAWYPANFPDKRFQLQSDNAAVAKVEDDKLRPLAAGSAQVTVTAAAGGVKARFQVTVAAKPKPPEPADTVVHVVSVSANSLSLLVGEEARPELSWTPPNAADKHFTLSTRDTDKLEIRGDRVVAKAAGSANVLVSARDGGKTATFTVTVTERDTRIRVQSLSAKDLNLPLGSEAFPELVWIPSDATDKTYLLTSADPAVIQVAGTRLRAVGTGTAAILVQSLDDATKTAAFKVTVAVPTQAVSADDMVLRAGGPDAEPRLHWNPANATDKGFLLSAAPSQDPPAAAVDNQVRPLKPGTLAFTVTPTGGAAPATFLVTVTSRLNSVSAYDTVIEEDARDLAPRLQWNPPDIEDKSYSLSCQDPAVSVQGARFSAAAIGAAHVTVTASEGGRQAGFQVTVVQKGCLAAMERVEGGAEENRHRRCCRETGRLCLDPDPPVVVPPVVIEVPPDTVPPVVPEVPTDPEVPEVPGDTVAPVVPVTPEVPTVPTVPADTLAPPDTSSGDSPA